MKRLAKLEPSYVTGGIEKYFEHYGKNLVLPENVKLSYHNTITIITIHRGCGRGGSSAGCPQLLHRMALTYRIYYGLGTHSQFYSSRKIRLAYERV